MPKSELSLRFLWACALALGLAYVAAAWFVSDRFGSVMLGIRDDEMLGRFLGDELDQCKLATFTLTAMVTGAAGALSTARAKIVDPAQIASIASIYLAVRVAIGGRGRLYGGVIGAAVVSLVSSGFAGGGAPDIDSRVYVIRWADLWLVLPGLSSAAIAVLAP